MFEHGGVSAPGGRDKQVHVATSVEIARPAEVIWPYLVNWEGLARWMSEARDFEVVGGQREGVGTEAMATISMFGFTTRDRVRVSRWDPPSILEIEHLGKVKGTGYMELSPTERGTRLFWRESLRPPLGKLGRMAFRLFRRGFANRFGYDLGLLRDLVERETSGGG